MRSLLIGACLTVFTLVGCTVINQPNTQLKTPQTQLQVREYQTREFDTNDTKLIMKAVLNTLQDDGFVVKNAVVDLGLLTAEKEIQISGSSSTASRNNNDTYWSDIFESVFRSSGASRTRNRQQPQQDVRYAKFRRIEVSVNISELGKRAKVRANFQAKTLDAEGQPMSVEAIQDLKFYQDFFVKVDKGIFIQKQGF